MILQVQRYCYANIIDSVESICRDRAIIQKNLSKSLEIEKRSAYKPCQHGKHRCGYVLNSVPELNKDCMTTVSTY